MPAVKLARYTQRVGKRTLFRDVSCTLDWSPTNAPGIIGLMGPSGSGKTSLLRQIMSGRYNAPLSGLLLEPADVVIGYVPQAPVLFQNLDVQENARMFAGMGRYRQRFDATLFSQLVDVLRLGSVLKERQSPQRLSGGEMQRLMLLRTLSIRPDLLLLDEPATGLDAAVRDTFLIDLCDTVERLRVATLYVGHHWEEISFVSSNVAYLVTSDGPAGSEVSDIPIKERRTFKHEPPTVDAFQAVYGPGCSIWPVVSDGISYAFRPVGESDEEANPEFVACIPAAQGEHHKFFRRASYRLSEAAYSGPAASVPDAWIYRNGAYCCRTTINISGVMQSSFPTARQKGTL